MNNIIMNRFVRLACTFMATAVLFLSTSPAVRALTDPGRYHVKIYLGPENSICIGQTTTLMVAYELNPGKTEEDPPSIFLQATNGLVASPNPTTGGMGAGFVYFKFTARQAGTAKLTAQANEGDGSDTKTIEVKKNCQYKYDLFISVLSTSSYRGFILKWMDIIKTEGTFTPAAADTVPLAPLAPQPPNGQMEATMTILDQKMAPGSDCDATATKWQGLTGSGTAYVTGQIMSGSPYAGVTVDFTNVHMKHDPSYEMPCKNYTISQILMMDLSANSWIHEQFPPWGGSRQIKIDSLEKGVEMLKAGGTDADYIAVLTLERIQ